MEGIFYIRIQSKIKIYPDLAKIESVEIIFFCAHNNLRPWYAIFFGNLNRSLYFVPVDSHATSRGYHPF